MQARPRAALAAGLLLLAVSGCATANVETCDPNAVRNLGTSLACDKHFKERIVRLEQRINEIEQTAALEWEAAAVAQAEADAEGANVRAELAAVNAIEAEIARLNLQLKAMRRQSEGDQRIVDAARRQIADAQRQLDAARRDNGPTVAQVEQLRTMVGSKRKAIDALGSLYEEII